MCASVSCLLYLMKMVVSVSIAAFQLILSWAIMVGEECCSLVDIDNGIHHGNIIKVLSTSSRPFQFLETLEE